MSARVQKLSDLREPPVVGQFYLVPAIESYPYCGKAGDWPVIGPKHTDRDFIRFEPEHYHVDARFLTAAQERHVLNYYSAAFIETVVGSAPLASRGHDLPKGRPSLIRRKCRRTDYEYAYSGKKEIKSLHEHYAGREAIQLDDGRVLCPHRKADLTQFPRDADDMVTCPLHGLRVRCAQSVPA